MREPRRVIVEFTQIGNSVKVTAVCEDTGREVSIVGDPRVNQSELERLAINKLKFVMRKEYDERDQQKRGLLI